MFDNDTKKYWHKNMSIKTTNVMERTAILKKYANFDFCSNATEFL